MPGNPTKEALAQRCSYLKMERDHALQLARTNPGLTVEEVNLAVGLLQQAVSEQAATAQYRGQADLKQFMDKKVEILKSAIKKLLASRV